MHMRVCLVYTYQAVMAFILLIRRFLSTVLFLLTSMTRNKLLPEQELKSFKIHLEHSKRIKSMISMNGFDDLDSSTDWTVKAAKLQAQVPHCSDTVDM